MMVLVVWVPPSETTALIGTPAKSVYSGIFTLLDFQNSGFNACISLRTAAPSGYLGAIQYVALTLGVSYKYSSTSKPLIFSFLPVGVSLGFSGVLFLSANLSATSAAAFIF